MEIIEGAVYSDHVHICVAIPPKLSVSDFVGYLKGKSVLMIFDKHKEFESNWHITFWSKDYYASTVGNITEDAKKSIFKNKKKKNKEKKQREIK